MRLNDSYDHKMALGKSDLNQIFKSIDILSQTSWRINNKVLEVIEAIWNNGGGYGEIPLK